jgi:hypothetical protein
MSRNPDDKNQQQQNEKQGQQDVQKREQQRPPDRSQGGHRPGQTQSDGGTPDRD